MRIGILVASIACAIDQVTKYIMVERVFRRDGMVETPFFTPELIEILPFFQFRMVWNTGVSFSLFDYGDATTVAILILLQLTIVGVLLWWLRQSETRIIAIGIGFIVGGALGNIIDRIHYGAVADFLDFHVAGYHFPTFNGADFFITTGVVFWLLDALVNRHQHSHDEKPE